MRRFLWLTVLFGCVGCQGLQERIHCRHSAVECSAKECAPPAKSVTSPPPPEKITAQPRESVAAPTIAQEVLFVPVTSYVPYARQTPTGPLRMTTMPPQPVVGGPPSDLRTPPPADIRTPPPCEDKVELKKLLDLCQKQCDRIDHLEKCLKERNASPAVICPPQPLLRRPLFNRCEPLFNRCEPLFNRCEPLVPCEPAEKLSMPAPLPTPSASPPAKAQPPVLTIQ